MIAPHYQQTVNRVKNSPSKYILAIQDQVRLNFTNHKAKTELGVIGKTGKTIQYGLIQHSVLMVTDTNEPLGLLNVDFFDYTDIDTSIHQAKRPISEKTNAFWINSLTKMRQRLENLDKKIITVADREGDFYEFFVELIKRKEEFVIRSRHNRILGDVYKTNGEKLRETLDNLHVDGTITVEIQDVDTREVKELMLSLKATTITLPVPKNMPAEYKKEHDYDSIKLNVVQAYSDEHEWIILTSLPIDTLEQLKEIIFIYRSRWHIEDYHKILKTGYQIDEIYLHTSKEAIKNLLILSSISACRLYWLIYIGRTDTEIKANKLFEEFEWKAIYVYFNQPIPIESPTIAEVLLMIARLGGHKGTKSSGPPGIKSMWIGYQQFSIAARMYRNMSN